MSLNVDVPALQYRPLYSSVSVQVEVRHGGCSMCGMTDLSRL